MKPKGLMFAIAAALLALAAPPSHAASLYLQSLDGSGEAIASQNDTSGAFGNYATRYDDFTLGVDATIAEIRWSGAYFTPPTQGTITAWTVTLLSDDAGQPGSALLAVPVSGTANETSLGSIAGFPFFSYRVSGLSFAATAGTKYWLSVVPDLEFPPQWGWGTSASGNDASYQDFFGGRSALFSDAAFQLLDAEPRSDAVPEPVSLTLCGIGAIAVGARRWRQRCSSRR